MSVSRIVLSGHECLCSSEGVGGSGEVRVGKKWASEWAGGRVGE